MIKYESDCSITQGGKIFTIKLEVEPNVMIDKMKVYVTLGVIAGQLERVFLLDDSLFLDYIILQQKLLYKIMHNHAVNVLNIPEEIVDKGVDKLMSNIKDIEEISKIVKKMADEKKE